MANSYILFGLKATDINLVRRDVERLFDIKFVLHDSDAVGEHFATPRRTKPRFNLYPNEYEDEVEDRLALRVPEFPEIPLILIVWGFEHGDNVEETLTGASDINAIVLERNE